MKSFLHYYSICQVYAWHELGTNWKLSQAKCGGGPSGDVIAWTMASANTLAVRTYFAEGRLTTKECYDQWPQSQHFVKLTLSLRASALSSTGGSRCL